MTAQREAILLLLYSFLVGTGLGLVYDAFRIFRIALYGRKKADEKKMQRLACDARSVEISLKSEISQAFPHPSFFLTFFCDVAFCVFSALTVTVMLFQFGDGRVRLFSLLGAFVGFVVYYFTFGKIVMLFSNAIISAIKTVICTVLRYTLYPVCAFVLKIGRRTKCVFDDKKRKKNTEKYIKSMLNKPPKCDFGEK